MMQTLGLADNGRLFTETEASQEGSDVTQL